jgi:hypothetical protein
MDQTLVLEQDEQVSTLASNPAFISALKDININLICVMICVINDNITLSYD